MAISSVSSFSLLPFVRTNSCPHPFLSDLEKYLSLALKQISGVKMDESFIIQKVKRAFIAFANPNVFLETKKTGVWEIGLLQKFGYDVQAGYITENRDLCSLLNKVVEKLPKSEKIDLLILQGHGNRDSILVSTSNPNDPSDRTSWRNLDKSNIKKSLACLDNLHKNAVIVLHACKTGKAPFQGSFAGVISKLSNRIVIAPETDIHSLPNMFNFLERIKAKQPLFGNDCLAWNSYRDGTIYHQNKIDMKLVSDCLRSFNKIKQTWGDIIDHPLPYAAANSLEAVKLLIEAESDVNTATKEGRSALAYAARGNYEAVQVLISAGADVSAATKKGITPLMFAATGKPEIIRALINAGADVNAVDINGATALMIAAVYSLEAVQTLIATGADVNVVDSEGGTALMFAATASVGAVQALIAAGADVNAVEREGKTALMIAIAANNLGAVQALIAAKADVNAVDREGKTALMIAKKHYPVAIQVLTNAGAVK